tara:strand:+ start:198 stop:1514 length:1317 start_codon:yes stop_codon:yes gene_type:complete
MKVSIIGFGHIGSVIGSVIASKEFTVVGIDKNKKLINNFLNNGYPISEPGLQELVNKKISDKYLTITNDLESISVSDVIIITVGTPLGDNNKPDLSHLSETCKEIEPYIKNGQLILVKSTIPPGTTRKIVHEILSNKKNIDVVFSPERLAEGNAINELKSLPIVVGGITNEATNRAAKFWEDTISVKTIAVNSAETAEMVKLANNAWIDLNIGLAHDLARLSDTLDFEIDIMEVISAANSLKKGSGNVNILTPSNGVGGYCLTKDPWFLHTLGKENGIELNTIKSGRISNEIMPEYSAKKIIDHFKEVNLDSDKVKIAVLGLSFKSNSGDIRFTPVLPFLNFLKNEGFTNISIYDPLVTSNDLDKINIKTVKKINEAIVNADCVAFMTAHEQILELSVAELVNKCKKETLIFDGRRYFSASEIIEIKKNGFNYKGIGR